MNNNFGIRNIERVQKALQQLQRITPAQIQKISKEESLAQLRFKKLQNMRQRFNNKNIMLQQVSHNGEEQRQKNPQGQVTKWSIFKQVPIIAYKQPERKYQKQFISKINQFRKNGLKEWIEKTKQAQSQPKQLNLQKQVIQIESDSQNQPQQKPEVNNIFLQNKTNPIFPQKHQSFPQQKPKVTGFVPNLTPTTQTNSGLFNIKFQAPSIQPPPQIGSQSSLFSQSNPLAHVKTNAPLFNINNAPKSNIFENNNKINNPPKLNIFEKKFDVPQPQPVKSLQTHGLFSVNNPIAEIQICGTEKNKFINNFPNTGLFSEKKQQTNKISQQVIPSKKKDSLTQEISKPSLTIQFTQQPQQSQLIKQPEISQLQTIQSKKPQTLQNLQNLQSQPNIFATSSLTQNKNNDNNLKIGGPTNFSNPQLFANNLTDNKKIEGQKNLGFLKNTILPNSGSLTTPLFTSSSNSLFGNNAKQSQPEKQKQPQKNIFKSSLSSSIFSGNHSEPQTEKKSFFNLKPVQVQIQKPKEGKQIKKANEIFKEFVNSNPSNMFNKSPKQGSNIGIFGKPIGEGTSIFPKTAGGGLFGNNQQSLFAKKDSSPIFGAKKQQQQQQENEEDGEDVDVIQDKEQIDPTKSTGNYKYQQAQILYRQNIPKFKRGPSPIIQNIIISIQKIAGNNNYTLTVRLSNKCINFSGTILPGVTQATRIKEDQYRNISVKKIMTLGEDKKPNLQLLKVQFRDEKQGQLFFNKMTQATKK